MTLPKPRFAPAIRSLLRVAGDDPAAIEAGLGGDCDALLIDMAVGADASRSGMARAKMRDLATRRGDADRKPLYIVLGGALCGRPNADLDVAILVEPDGIMLPKMARRSDMFRLASRLAVREALHGIPDGRTGIIGLLDCAAMVLRAGEIGSASRRLAGVTWDAASLAGELSIPPSHVSLPGEPLQLARNTCLFAAAAARLPAIDTASAGLDHDLFREICRKARRVGFAAKIAIDAAQATMINEIFASR